MITELRPDLDRSITRRFATAGGRRPRAADRRRPRSERHHRAPGRRRRGSQSGSSWVSSRTAPRSITAPRSRSRSSGITDEIENVRSLRAAPPADLEHGPRDPGRRDPPPDRVTGRDARQRPRGHRDRIAGDGLGERQPARAVRRRCRTGHPRRGDPEDRVRPRGGPPPHRRVRLPARGCPRPGGVRHAQRREQGPHHQPRDTHPAASPSSSSTRSSGSSTRKGAIDHGHTDRDSRARDRPGRGRPRPPDDGSRYPRTLAVPHDPVRARRTRSSSSTRASFRSLRSGRAWTPGTRTAGSTTSGT